MNERVVSLDEMLASPGYYMVTSTSAPLGMYVIVEVDETGTCHQCKFTEIPPYVRVERDGVLERDGWRDDVEFLGPLTLPLQPLQ